MDGPGSGSQSGSDVQCATLAPLGSGTCSVDGAGGGALLLEGNVLTPSAVFHGGQVASTRPATSRASTATARSAARRRRPSPARRRRSRPASSTRTTTSRTRRTRRTATPASATSSATTGARASRPHRRSRRRRGATRRADPVGRAALPHGRRHVDRRHAAASRPAPQPRHRRRPGGPRQAGRRLRHLPARRLERHAPTGGCAYGGTPSTAMSIATIAPTSRTRREGIDATAHNEFLCESSTTFDMTAPGVSDNLVRRRPRSSTPSASTPADYEMMAGRRHRRSSGRRAPTSPLRRHRAGHDRRARSASTSRSAPTGPSGSMNLLRELPAPTPSTRPTSPASSPTSSCGRW